MAKFEIPPASELTEPAYFVFFRSRLSTGEDYEPLVSSEVMARQIADGYGTFPLLFDGDLIPALPLLLYTLHLPRTRFDFHDISVRALKRAQRHVHMPHLIALLPLPFRAELARNIFSEYPKLILVPDDLSAAERSDIADAFTLVVEITSRSQLTGRLSRYWEMLYQALGVKRPAYIKASRELGDPLIGASLLPVQFVARQLGGGSDSAVPSSLKSQSDVLGFGAYNQALLSAIAEMEEAEVPRDEAERIAPDRIKEHRATFKCPVVLGLSGVSPKSPIRAMLRSASKHGIRSRRRELSDGKVERSVLGLLVAHRALSRNGLGILAQAVSDGAFQRLRDLELLWRHSSLRGPKPRSVWKALREIGESVAGTLRKEELSAITHASSLTCFSEFPIGLAILPGDTAPLCCRMPISYRPIVPLTRALQFELGPVPTCYLKENPRVIIVETIPQSSRVGRLSRVGWEAALDMLQSDSRIRADFVEVDSVEDFRRALAAHEYDIVVISAHGHLDNASGRAGIVLGRGDIQGPELGTGPKIVCLSACDVSSRGDGVVNISDLLFRQGALAVLAPMIPVDVRHNATLMVRFFIYISETIEGRTHMRSLDEAWHFTSMSNAVNDIVATNPAIGRWRHSGPREKSVINEFMLDKSVGRLRSNHVYEDTQEVLQEIARDRGMLPKFRAWLAGGYLPESAFYAFLGWPERMILHDEIFDEVGEALKESDSLR